MTEKKGALFIFLVLAVAIYGSLIHRQGLWVDEVSSLARATGHSLEHPASDANPAEGDFQEQLTAQLPAFWGRYLQHDTPPESLKRVIRGIFLSDTNPPVYYVVLHFWTRLFGTDDFTLRAFSVLCSLFSIPLLWSFGRQLSGSRGATISSLLFILAPIGMYYSIEGRMYSLLWFELLAFAWCLFRLRDKGWKPLTALLCVVTGSAALLTHYYALFVWLALVLWVTLTPGRSKWIHRGVIVLATVAMIAPWYVLVPETFARWRVTAQWLRQPSPLSSTVLSPVVLCWRMISPHVLWGHQLVLDSLIGIPVAIMILLVVMKRPSSETQPSPFWLWAWLILACAGPAIQDLLLRTSAATERRYALQGFPATQLLLGAGLSRLKTLPRRILLVLLIAGYLIGMWALFFAPVREQRNFREIGAQLTKLYQPGDVLIVHSIPQGVLATARYIEAPLPIASWVGQLRQRKTPDDIQRLIAGKTRVIFLRIHDLDEPAPEEKWLRAHAKLLQQQSGRGYDLLFFQPESMATGISH